MENEKSFIIQETAEMRAAERRKKQERYTEIVRSGEGKFTKEQEKELEQLTKELAK